MNFLILNERSLFNNVNIKGFKEVDINGTDRIDGIFGSITPSLLEQLDQQRDGGNPIFREQWLLRDRGVMFMVFKIPEDILHNEHTEIIEKVFKLYDEENFYIETWSYCIENTWVYYIICLNKNLGFHTMNDQQIFSKKINRKNTYGNELDHSIDLICKKIEKIIEI